MRFRNLFTPSFRNRLRLFFLVIVVIPMIAVAVVLFQIVTRSDESQTDAQLSEVIHKGKGVMPRWEGQLSEAEIQAVLKHVRSLGTAQ